MKNVITEAAKVYALFKEKVWLGKYVCQKDVTKVHVECVDMDLLEETTEPEYLRWRKRILLFDKAGFLLFEVGVSEDPIKIYLYNPSTWFPGAKTMIVYSDSETLASALLRCDGLAGSVFYIVKLEKEKRRSRTFELTLYKPPKNFNLQEWIEKIKIQAHLNLGIEFDAIDKLGE